MPYRDCEWGTAHGFGVLALRLAVAAAILGTTAWGKIAETFVAPIYADPAASAPQG